MKTYKRNRFSKFIFLVLRNVLKYRKLPIIIFPRSLSLWAHLPLNKKKYIRLQACPVACIEMNSTFYDVLKLKKAMKFKKYFDQLCSVACFETLLFSLVTNSGNTQTDFRISLIKRFTHQREYLIIKLLMILPFLHL